MKAQSPDTQALVGSLARFRLVRDDSGPHRVYRDAQQRTYESVTHVLQATQDRTKLIAWLAAGGRYATNMREVSATRGRLVHSYGEYILKTARHLATNSANRRNLWKQTSSGLWRCPSSLTKWALENATKSAPKVGFSARGYAEALRGWILENVTAIYLIEFSVCYWVESQHRGFAGTADALLEVNKIGPLVVDWKSTEKQNTPETIESHVPQVGAYSLGLQSMAGIYPEGGAIVLIRRSGTPSLGLIDYPKLKVGSQAFLDRFLQYCATPFSDELSSCTSK